MKPRAVLMFYAAVIAAMALIAVVFPGGGLNVGVAHLRYPTLHSIMGERNSGPVAEVADEDTATVVAVATLRDTIDMYRRMVGSGDLRFWLPSAHYFDAMWAAMEGARERGRTVRILHYGDSQIELDHISSRLRANMQDTFGGGGPGMLPFRTITPTLTVRQSTSGELTHLSSFGDSMAVRSRGNYGLMMQCFRLDGAEAVTTVRAAATSLVDAKAKAFDEVHLIFRNRGTTSYEITNLKDKKSAYHGSTDSEGVVSVAWRADTLTDGVRVRVAGRADLYALLVDDGRGGVAVDNIPMRGCSGQQFTQVDADLLSAAYATMDVGLIIMQFGGNSVPYIRDTAQVVTYCQSIGKQIDYVHRCCPSAKVLFIGPSDMSKRIQGEMQTYPMLPVLIDSLAATANRHDAAYWSIYHAMGGLNSMPQWTRQGMAGKDYIHFSQKGADVMGERLFEALMNSYRLYGLERRLDEQERNARAAKRGDNTTRKRR